MKVTVKPSVKYETAQRISAVKFTLHCGRCGAACSALGHAAAAFGLPNSAKFADKGAKGGGKAGTKRKREESRGRGDAQQQALMAPGWLRVR